MDGHVVALGGADTIIAGRFVVNDDLDGAGEPPADEASQRMFEASRSDERTEPADVRPWGGPGSPKWKRLLAAVIRAGGINIGRFPE